MAYVRLHPCFFFRKITIHPPSCFERRKGRKGVSCRLANMHGASVCGYYDTHYTHGVGFCCLGRVFESLGRAGGEDEEKRDGQQVAGSSIFLRIRSVHIQQLTLNWVTTDSKTIHHDADCCVCLFSTLN